MKKIKLAIIGCGRVFEHYKKIIKRYDLLNKFDITAVCDKDKDRAVKASDYFNCSYFLNYLDMLEDHRVDLVAILTPSGLHFSQTKFILEKGISSIVEKPLAMRVEEIIELEKIASENNVKIYTAFQNRFNPAIGKLKTALRNNTFGSISVINVNLFWCRYQDYYDDEWHGSWEFDGGVINQQAIHHIDALIYLFGDVNKVISLQKNIKNRLEAEDTTAAILEMNNGAICSLLLTTAARPRDYEASISVAFENGFVKIDGIALNQITTWNVNGSESPELKIEFSEEVENGYGISHFRFLNSIYDDFLNPSHLELIPLDGVITTSRLIHSIYASNETGRWISLSENLSSKKLGLP